MGPVPLYGGILGYDNGGPDGDGCGGSAAWAATAASPATATINSPSTSHLLILSQTARHTFDSSGRHLPKHPWLPTLSVLGISFQPTFSPEVVVVVTEDLAIIFRRRIEGIDRPMVDAILDFRVDHGVVNRAGTAPQLRCRAVEPDIGHLLIDGPDSVFGCT